jgi:RNA polymerase sigma-70 factor, ECF subfamily
MERDTATRNFEELLAAHEAMVWTLCLRMTGSRELARDAHQECFIRVWQGLPAFRGEAKPSTWIWRIAVRCCRETLDRERRLPLDGGEGALEGLADPARSTEAGLEARDSADFLLGFLKPRERALVHLFYTQELSCEEVAAALGMRPGAVRTALHRAREAMRAGWEQAHAEPGGGTELPLAEGARS